jgi:hypothetical protein
VQVVFFSLLFPKSLHSKQNHSEPPYLTPLGFSAQMKIVKPG